MRLRKSHGIFILRLQCRIFAEAKKVESRDLGFILKDGHLFDYGVAFLFGFASQASLGEAIELLNR